MSQRVRGRARDVRKCLLKRPLNAYCPFALSVPRVSPFRACEVHAVSGANITLAPWPLAARLEVRNLPMPSLSPLTLRACCTCRFTQGARRISVQDEELDDDDAMPGAPFGPDGVATVSRGDLMDCTLLTAPTVDPTDRGPSVAPIEGQTTLTADGDAMGDTAAHFKAAAAALAAHRAAAAQHSDDMQRRTERRGGVSGIGGLLKHLRAAG